MITETIAAYISRIFRDRLVIGDEVADAGRADQQFGKDGADEARRGAEPQSGEDHRAGRGSIILKMVCARVPRKARPISSSEFEVCRTAL